MMFNRKRTLEHDALYEAQAARIADVKRIDEVLRGVHDAIATNAEAFPIVPGTARLRIAKTRRFSWEIGDEQGVIPHLVIWFSIEDESKVRLRAIDVDLALIDSFEDDFDEEL